MKTKSVFKKSAIFAVALLLIVLTAISVIPMMTFAAEDEVNHGEKLDAINVSFSGNVSMLFYYTGLDDWKEDDYIVVKLPQQNGSVKETRHALSTLETDTKTKGGQDVKRWIVEVPLAAAQMTDTITMQWFKDGQGGKIREKSLKANYADKIFELEKTDTSNTYSEIAQVLRSMLNYGAMAQQSFGYNNSSDLLANNGLFAEGSNPVDGMLAEHFYDAKDVYKDGDNVEFQANVYLQDKVSMRVYFNSTSEIKAVYVRREDKESKLKVTVHTDDIGDYVNIINIAAQNFDKHYYVEVETDNGTSTVGYSVLNYAITTLKNFLSTPEEKNTAKSIYLYYTWMKSYTDETYIAGPKTTDDQSNVVSACDHKRSHVEGEYFVCSDCGNKDIVTKLFLVRTDTNEICAGTTTTITLELHIAGTVDFSAIVTTLKATDGLNIECTAIEWADDSIVGDNGTNICIYPAEGDGSITAEGKLATLTCTVSPDEDIEGDLSFWLQVREATNGDMVNNTESIVTTHSTIKVERAKCEECNTIYGRPTATGHVTYCDKCQRVNPEEAHTYTSISAAANGKLTVNTKACVCGYVANDSVTNVYDLGFALDENDKKIEKAPLFFLSPSEIAANAKNSGTRMGAVEMAKDNSYVTLHNKTDATAEGYFSLISSETETGRYLAIKYRTTSSSNMEIFAGANNGKTEAKGGENFYLAGGALHVKDGEWHVVIFDLAMLRPSQFKPDTDGKYRADYIRWDIFNDPKTTDQTVDVAYVAMSDDIMSVASFAGNEYYRVSTKLDATTSVAQGSYMGSTVTLNPVADGTWIQYSGHIGGQTHVLESDAVNGGLKYSHITRKGTAGDNYVQFIGISQVTGVEKHYAHTTKNAHVLAIIYRTNTSATHHEGWANSTAGGAQGSEDKFLGHSIISAANADHKWRVAIVNLDSAFQNASGTKTNYYDPTLGLTTLRFDYWNINGETDIAEGALIGDFAFFGVFESADDAYAYCGDYLSDYVNVEGGQGCMHDAISDYKSDCHKHCELCGEAIGEKSHVYPTVWSVVEGRGEDGKLYESRTCTRCGEIEKRELFFYSNFDSIMVNSKVTKPSAGNAKQSDYLKRGKYAFGSYSAADNFNDGAGTNYTVSNDLKISGWVAVNGGVDRIVFKIGDGAWQNTTGTVKADTGGIKTWITTNLKDIDLASAASACNFQGGVTVPAAALQAHAGETVTITFAYVPKANPGAADDPNMLIFAEVTNMFIACDHSRNTNNDYTFDASNPQKFSAACSICGEKTYKETDVTDKGLMFFGPEFFAGKNINSNTSVELKTDGNTGMVYARYTVNKDLSSEQTLYLFDNGNSNRMNSGNAVAFLYRTTASNIANEIFIRGNTATLSGTHGKSVSIDKCGEWRLAVVTKNATWDSSTGINTLRLDIFNGTVSKGTTFDIAYLACFEDEQAAWGYFGKYAAAYSKGEDAWCNHPHNAVQHVWDSEAKVYKNTCPCGEILPNTDMIYKSEAQKADGNGYTATQEGGITKYTVKSGTSSGTDFYTHIYQSSANVTGDYAVIKYRLTNNGNDASNRSWYAGTAASGYTSARGGTVSDASLSRLVTLTDDGQWHYIIVSFNDTNKAYVKNSDGTYTWSYLRMGFNPSKYDNSVYLEIDEIAFADCYEAASIYMYTHDTQDYFVVNLDKTHCTLNGQTTVTNSVRSTANKPLVIDGSAFTLKTPTGLTLGGWCVTPDGVKQYGYRVTSVDGVAQENPVLFSTFTGSNSESSNTGITNVGVSQGYIMSKCRLGAGFQGKKSADLIAYSGKTVNLELVAITTYGNIIPIVKINNIAVPTMYNSYVKGDHFVDSTNVKDNATIASGIVFADKIVFDLSDVAVNTNSTFKMNGWVTTNGGIASYKYRVIEGENVYEVAATGTISTNSTVTADGINNGFDADCAINGSFTDLKFSLADVKNADGEAVDLNGKAITVQMIAVTNNGDELVVATFNNVAVGEVVFKPEVPTYVHITNFGGKKDIAAQPSAIVNSTAFTTSTSAAYLGRIYITGRVAIKGSAQKLVYRLLDANGNQIQGWQELDYYGSNNYTMTDVTTGTAHLGTAQKEVPEVTNVYEYVGLANITAFPGQTVTVECALVLDGVEGEDAYHTFATFKNVKNTESAS